VSHRHSAFEVFKKIIIISILCLAICDNDIRMKGKIKPEEL
jgi:hypothetical protein